MTATQLDLFGDVEAAEHAAADQATLADRAAAERRALIARLQYERELANTCIGFGLYRESASGWPNGKPVGAAEAIAAMFREDERDRAGEMVPGATGSCRRCHHTIRWHRYDRWACMAPDCDCAELHDRVVDHLRVEVLPGAVLSVRTVADVMTERWAARGLPWPEAAAYAAAAAETIC